MLVPMLPGRSHRTGGEDPGQESRLQELSRGYEDSPWLTLLVTFSGFLLVFVGSLDAIFLIGTALTGQVWLPYALILAALAGTYACLWGLRYKRRHPARRRGRRQVS